mmetsp:Transcript_27118/g.59979  ORF Transcript_27118/g.59979 Transcript_27118/m.59979 type:complete len:278 (-) Transcript_27118:190-1023(-)
MPVEGLPAPGCMLGCMCLCAWALWVCAPHCAMAVGAGSGVAWLSSWCITSSRAKATRALPAPHSPYPPIPPPSRALQLSRAYCACSAVWNSTYANPFGCLPSLSTLTSFTGANCLNIVLRAFSSSGERTQRVQQGRGEVTRLSGKASSITTEIQSAVRTRWHRKHSLRRAKLWQPHVHIQSALGSLTSLSSLSSLSLVSLCSLLSLSSLPSLPSLPSLSPLSPLSVTLLLLGCITGLTWSLLSMLCAALSLLCFSLLCSLLLLPSLLCSLLSALYSK